MLHPQTFDVASKQNHHITIRERIKQSHNMPEQQIKKNKENMNIFPFSITVYCCQQHRLNSKTINKANRNTGGLFHSTLWCLLSSPRLLALCLFLFGHATPSTIAQMLYLSFRFDSTMDWWASLVNRPASAVNGGNRRRKMKNNENWVGSEIL